MASHNREKDTLFLFFCSLFVFMMQAGFSLLEAGTVRSKNVRNILLKNLLDACLGGVLFWLVGYGIAYGGSNDNGFAGNAMGVGKYSFAFRVNDDNLATEYEASSAGYSWVGFFFQFCFAAASTTIVSGAVAGRCTIPAYFVYSSVIITVIYPVVVHWVWDSEGWISAFNLFNDDRHGSPGRSDGEGIYGGAIDFAGSGVVHMTGGVAALVSSIVLGPRKGRFQHPEEFKSHSAPLQVLGTMLLWVGWYGFNCGSTLGISGYARDVGRVAVTTTLAAAGGGLSALFLVFAMTGARTYDLGALCNGILGGLVGITAGCSVVEPFAALIIGLMSGILVVLCSKGVEMCGIDDVLDAFAVHGACGAFGVIVVGALCKSEYSYNVHGYDGFFYSGEGHLLGIQLLLVLCIFAWVASTTAMVMIPMQYAGILRLSDEIQDTGIDVHEHEGPAYQIVDIKHTYNATKSFSPKKESPSETIAPPSPQKTPTSRAKTIPRVGSDVQLAPIGTIPAPASMDNVPSAAN